MLIRFFVSFGVPPPWEGRGGGLSIQTPLLTTPVSLRRTLPLSPFAFPPPSLTSPKVYQDE